MAKEVLRIGIIREGKVPPDKRVAFTPLQVEEIQQRYPEVKIICQKSEIRCFKDEEYKALGITVQEHVDECEILMGIKEVPIDQLIPGKTYLFFSHTIKKQPYNRNLLREILKKKIRLIDYETLKDSLGNRLVAFGRYAGIVGAYNGLWTYGKRYGIFSLRRAYECFDVNDLKLELRKIKLPAIKIILTGAGRVGKGAMETLDTAGIRKVSAGDFLNREFREPVYTQLSSSDYHIRIGGGHFNRDEFHQYPERYSSYFNAYTKVADVLMAGAYWNPKAPVLFTKGEMQSSEFRIKVIADITCDMNGSVPSTKRASSIIEPIYDYNPISDSIELPLSDDSFITIMAIDNLPCELPRSASEEFGRDLIDRILPLLIAEDKEKIIERATIAEQGELTPPFMYLKDYVA
ncbi:NAD(P)-dependent oxidoreductase [Chryseosolibacter indicus]|uniref:Saccharopine dehydrogenase [NAD(+), L-lysine-forming] n=1 Tax=Chryseosolibacter indicus TaxID=2782351 RepID=A0ABS5VMN1_9BACT|nr:NAD(P)-dependent oxidoreductase [Chryseosolibacter indicus]MBT1702703.1 NAD(P)-dependent oxidoreductase [Chryseosolibacter indicus]